MRRQVSAVHRLFLVRRHCGTPGAIFGAMADGGFNLDVAIGICDMPGPLAKLVKTCRIHDSAGAIPEGLPAFLNGGSAGREHQVAGDTAGVGVKCHAGCAHGFDNLDPEGAHLHLGAFKGRSA